MKTAITRTTLEIDVRPERERVVVTPSGELDLATVDQVEREVMELCCRGFQEVCLDLSRLSFFDSSGLRLLAHLETALASERCRFTVMAGDGAAARVLRLVRLEERFLRVRPRR